MRRLADGVCVLFIGSLAPVLFRFVFSCLAATNELVA